MSAVVQKGPRPRKNKDIKIGKSFWIIIIFLAVYFLGNVWQSVSITRLNRQNLLLRQDYEKYEKQYNLLVQSFEEKRQLARVLQKLDGKLVPAEVINLSSK